MLDKTQKTIVISLSILLFTFPVVALYTSKHFETTQRYYKNHTSELYEGHWVPKIFPNDIHEIYESHNIDTNRVWLKFDRGKKHIQTRGLVQLTKAEKEKINIAMPSFISWWFEGIIEQQPSNDNALHAQIFQGECGKDRTSYLAVPKEGDTYHWWCQN